MQRLCVFCGSATGQRPAYAAAARGLGDALARRGIHLVYGGGSIGLMGVLADAVLAAGGAVTGVIPRGLYSAEIAHAGLTDLRVVPSMHERKATMAALADGFVALPGGLGTFEELLEVLTWLQLGIHRKPVALLDVEDYWRGLRLLLDDSVAGGFVEAERAAMLLVERDGDALIDRMRAWTPPPGPRIWLTPAEA
jgi:uncharacterized protein (TIGR00730 family)